MDRDTLVQKMLEVYGGREKLESVQSVSARFKFAFYQPNGSEMGGEGTEYFKKPDKNYFEFRFPGLTMRNSCDGKSAWQKEGEGEITSIDTDRFVVHTRLRTFPLFLVSNPPEWEYKGTVDLDDLEQAHWVQIKYSEKEKVSLYLDPQTLLLARYQGPSRAMGMKVTTVVLLDDYKEIQGIPFPMHQTFLINVNKFQERMIQEIEFNKNLPDSLFQLQS